MVSPLIITNQLQAEPLVINLMMPGMTWSSYIKWRFLNLGDSLPNKIVSARYVASVLVMTDTEWFLPSHDKHVQHMTPERSNCWLISQTIIWELAQKWAMHTLVSHLSTIEKLPEPQSQNLSKFFLRIGVFEFCEKETKQDNPWLWKAGNTFDSS